MLLLKGSTIIELTNVKTGETERYEDNNLITGAINDIVLKRKQYYYFNGGDAYSSGATYNNFWSLFPLYKGFFGGMLLFGNNIDETRKFLSGDDVVVGSATFGDAYSGSSVLVGSYNETESEINETDGYAKFVYDFATNQANGTISAVSLCNYNFAKFRLYGGDVDADRVTSNVANSLHIGLHGAICQPYKEYSTPNLVVVPKGVNNNNYQRANSSEHSMMFDAEKGYLYTLEYVSSTGSVYSTDRINGVRLHIYDLHTKEIDIFSSLTTDSYGKIVPTEIYTKDFEISEIAGTYVGSSYNSQYGFLGNCDKGVAYLLGGIRDSNSSWVNGSTVEFFKFDFNVESFDNITMETIEITNNSGYTLDIPTKKSGGSNCFRFYDGYLYAGTKSSSGYYFVKINITDSTDVEILNTNERFFADIQGDLIYLVSDNTGYMVKSNVFVFNTKTEELKPCGCTHASKVTAPIEIKNNDCYTLHSGYQNNSSGTSTGSYQLTWAGAVASRSDYLATINNLTTPVTKTADVTMKITYILREVAE